MRQTYATRHRTGLLLFISELERQVVVRADSGIDQCVGQDGWQAQVDRLTSRIREGRAVDGVLEVIGALRGPLAAALPVQPNDTNELPNEIVTEP